MLAWLKAIQPPVREAVFELYIEALHLEEGQDDEEECQAGGNLHPHAALEHGDEFSQTVPKEEQN